MYRILIILGLLVVLYLVLRSVVREIWGKRRENQPLLSKNQMLQDPVCRVYIPRESAVAASIGGQTYYFCSNTCAETFQKQFSG